MFRNSLTFGRISGIELKAHWSVLVIFGLIAAHLGFGVFPQWHPEWSVPMTATVALGAAIIFFASLLLHELAHAFAARGYGLEVGDITLFLFGGVSDIESEPESALSEAVIAGVGPLASLVIGISMIAVAAGSIGNPEQLQTDPEAFLSSLGPLMTILLWVGPINLLLAVFNLIPAFPLDGGRIVRAAMWGISGNLKTATRWAATLSRAMSWGFIGVGIAMAFGVHVPLFGSGLVGGLWLALIGWFIGQSAKASLMMNRMSDALEGVTTGEVATEDVATVTSDTPLQQVAQNYLRGSAGETVLVRDGDRFTGIVGLGDIKQVPRDQWTSTTVGQVMTRADSVETVSADTPAFDAFKRLGRARTSQLPVVDSEGA